MSAPVNDAEKVKCLEDREEDLVCRNQGHVEERESDPSNRKNHENSTPQTTGNDGIEADDVNIAAVESGDFSWEGFEVVDELDDDDGSSLTANRSVSKSNGRHHRERHRSRSNSRSRSSHQSGDSRRHRYRDSIRHRDRYRCSYSDRKSKYSESEDKGKSSKESKQDSAKENRRNETSSKTILQSQENEVEQDKEDESHKNEREWKEERNIRAEEIQNSSHGLAKSDKAKEAREGKQKHDGDGLSSTREKSQTSKSMKKVSCRSSWKNFKRVLVVCDSRINLDESSLKECCSINVQVLSKPYLTFDDIPALLSDCIDQSSPVATLLICSVGTYGLIKIQDSERCKELLHEPFKYISIRSKESEDPETNIIKQSKDLKKTLQQLLGMESEIYFTSILPFSFKLYQEFQTTKHKNATEHETLNDVSESDLNDWEQKVHEDISLFNEYHVKTYPLRLSLQLANFTQCFVKKLENFFETCTVDGLNFREEVSREITTNLGKAVDRYCTVRGKYEKVILVGDSRLDYVRRAWPLDVRYNCKFLTCPKLKLMHLCDSNNQVVKELSHSRNSLIVISLGLYDLCNLAPHPECSSHPREKLEVLILASYSFTVDDVKEELCKLMTAAASNLRRMTNNCDIIFSTIYDFDLLTHQTYLLSKHEKEVLHIVRKPILRMNSKFNNKLRRVVSAVALFNKISVVYSQKNSFPVWDTLSVISDQVLFKGRYCPISPEVLCDGVHPSPAVAERMAEKYRMLADDALMIESSSKDVRSESLDAIVNACKKKIKYLGLFNSHQWKQLDENQDKEGDTLACDEQSNSFQKFESRHSSEASTLIMQGEGSCQSPSALLSEISDSGSSGPLDDAASTSSFTEERHPRSTSPSFSRQWRSHQIPVNPSSFSGKYPKQCLPHLRRRPAWVNRYPRSPSPVRGRSYRRWMSSPRRSRSRSMSPGKHPAKYMRSVSYTAQKGYTRSPSPFEREKRPRTPPYYARRNRFSRSPSVSGRSYSSISPSRRSPSPDNVRHWRDFSENSREGKALAALRDVHARECAVYRKHPLAHPDFDKEYRLFKNKKQQCVFDLGGDPNTYDLSRDWQLFWPNRLEELLEESWSTKWKKCLALLRSESTKLKRKKRSRSRSSSEVSTSNVKLSKKASKSLRKAKDYKSSTESPEVKRRYSDEDIDNRSSDDDQRPTKHESDTELGGKVKERSVSEEDIPKKENELGRINSDDVAHGSVNPEKHEVNNSPSVDGKSTKMPDWDKDELGNNTRLYEGSMSYGKIPSQHQQLLKNPGSNLMSGRMNLMEMRRERSTAQNTEDNTEKWRNQDSENSHFQSTSKEEPADEVTSTTPSFEDEKQEDFIGVLEILNRMGEKLGLLKLPLKVVLDRALQYQSKGLHPSELLKVKDTKTLFVMISEKLKEMANEDNLNIITKVVLQEANERLSRILKASGPELDISQIAQKCLGKNESDTVAYIQSQFLEQGISEPTNAQLKEVYEAVRQERSRLLTQILKQTSIESSSLHMPLSNSSCAAAPTPEDVKYSPTQAGWSSDDSQEACLSQSRSRSVISKDDHDRAEASNIGVPRLPESKEGLYSAPQFSVQPSKQPDVSSSSYPLSKQEPVVNTHLSSSLSKLTRNVYDSVYDSLSENYVGDKSTKTRTVLSSTLDYGLASPSTSKEQFSQPFESYSSADGTSFPPKPLLTTSQGKASRESSFPRKDPIRLVIPKGKDHGQNLSSSNPEMDDSGWQ